MHKHTTLLTTDGMPPQAHANDTRAHYSAMQGLLLLGRVAFAPSTHPLLGPTASQLACHRRWKQPRSRATAHTSGRTRGGSNRATAPTSSHGQQERPWHVGAPAGPTRPSYKPHKKPRPAVRKQCARVQYKMLLELQHILHHSMRYRNRASHTLAHNDTTVTAQACVAASATLFFWFFRS